MNEERERIMGLEFRSRHFTAEFESPFENFRIVQSSGEIRTCPLSGHITRILPMRARQIIPADLEPLVSKSKAGCPFCPEAVESKTPRFPEGFAPDEGRIRFNETVIFPNAFPYDRYNAVAVICREHFLSLAQFGPALLAQALGGCLRYLRRALEVFADARQAMLTWNYMPLAGAGLVHPHFHLAALPEVTSFYRTILDRQTNYSPRGERSIFDDVVAKEIEEKKRYLARMGTWDWLVAFAPRGIYEFWAISRKRATILELEEGDISDLAAGLSIVLGFLQAKGIQALNMGWYSLYNLEHNGLRNWVSIVPRLSLTPVGTSDSNYFDRLHAESSTFSIPEEVTLEAKKFFEP